MALVIPNTPRSSIVKGKNGSYLRLNWNSRIKRFNGQYTKAQIWLDATILKDSEQFVPLDAGMLARSGKLGTKLGSGEIRYIAPYARYLYYGKLMVDAETGSAWARKNSRKVLTDKNLVFINQHPRSQAFWYKAAEAQNKQKWIAGARKIAGGG